MREPLNAQRATCQQFASTLALLDAPHDDAWQAAQTHLAGCAFCQADQRAYARFDAALRDYAGPAADAAGVTLSTANLLANIGATAEPHAANASIRSARYLKDFDDLGGMETMSETERHDPTTAAPERTVAAIPDLRTEARVSQQAWAIGFSATAAALVLIVVAVSLFGSHWRLNVAHLRLAHTTATQATSLPATASASIAAVSMDSPTDGWALGDATLNPTVEPTSVGVGFYHYDGHTWRFIQRIEGLSIHTSSPAKIKMLTPTDGWAYVSSSPAPLHYDGKSWQLAPITLTSAEQLQQLVGFDMVSPTEGWAAAYLTGGSAGPGAIGFLHYDGQQWTVEKNVFAPSDIDLRNTVISGFSSIPGVVWAVGWATRPNQSGYNPPVGLIFVRYNDNGVWSYYQQGNPGTGVPSTSFRDIVMLTPGSGWIVGETDHATTLPDGSTTLTTSALLLRYDVAAAGPHWEPVSIQLEAPEIARMYLRVEATSERNVWISGTPNGSTIYGSGFESTSMLLHYDGSNWTQVKPTVDIGKMSMGYITTIDLASNGDLWAAGGYWSVENPPAPDEPLIWRYRDGIWSAASIATK